MAGLDWAYAQACVPGEVRNLGGGSSWMDSYYGQAPKQPASQQGAPAATSFSSNALQSFLSEPGQAAPTTNRFSAGLTAAENRLTSLLDNPDSIQQSAAYKFRLGQGQEALQRQQAARGMLGSGNRLQELMDYGQGQASQEYGAQANRLQQLLSGQQQGYTSVYGTDVGAQTAQRALRGNMLTSMYGTDVGAQTAANALAQQQAQFDAKNTLMPTRGISTRWV